MSEKSISSEDKKNKKKSHFYENKKLFKIEGIDIIKILKKKNLKKFLKKNHMVQKIHLNISLDIMMMTSLDHWRRRILEKQKALRKDLGHLNRMKRNEGTKSKLERKYRIEQKGIVVVHEEVQQRLVATEAKLERYDNRTEQYRQNHLFESNQKKLFYELDGVERETVVPDTEESTRFWSNMWGKLVKHEENPEWLRNVEEELTGLGVQDNIHIEVTKLNKQVRKMPNWKSPDPDGVQGYCIKNLNNLYGNIAVQLDRCLQENSVPSWIVTGKTLLCVKELEKGNAVASFSQSRVYFYCGNC